MNKRIVFYIWVILLSNAMSLMLVGCNATTATPTITPTQKLPTLIPSIAPIQPTSTPTPAYLHFTPPEKSNIHLEFDYPSSWIFSKDTQYADFMIISLADPRFSTVPTQSPNESHGTPSDFGGVSIFIEPIKPGQTLDTLFESYKSNSSDISWIIPLKDYKINLNGYDASVMEDQIKPLPYLDGNGYTSLMFERNIFFAVKNQIYQITFTVADKERGDEFEQGYEYFFNSLKVIP